VSFFFRKSLRLSDTAVRKLQNNLLCVPIYTLMSIRNAAHARTRL